MPSLCALREVREGGKRFPAKLTHDQQHFSPLGAELLLESLPDEPRDGR